jgi:2-iminobutanoate/2-iminopropanoate deaminase
MCEGSIEDCTRQALKNLQAILAASGVSTQNVVKTTVVLTDIADFPRANAVYGEFFEQPYPARSAFQVAALPLNGRIEIEAIVDLG